MVKSFILYALLLSTLFVQCSASSRRGLSLISTGTWSGTRRRASNSRTILNASTFTTSPDGRRKQKFSKTARPYTAGMYSQRSLRPDAYTSVSSVLRNINILMFGLQMMNPAVTQWGIKLSEPILRGEQLYRLLSPVFLHGDFAHIAMNTFSLENVGPMSEQILGRGRFLCMYLFSGIAGNYLSAVNSPNPALGASGAVFGVMGSYLTFVSMNQHVFGSYSAQMISGVGRTVLMNIALGAMNPRIDNWGHIGGAIGGVIFTTLFGPRLKVAALQDGSRMLIDEPFMRLPRPIEALPERTFSRLAKMTRRLQVNKHVDNLPERPWRPKPGTRPQSPGLVPNRSIRPSYIPQRKDYQ